MQKKMCARKKKEKSIPATPIAKGDELPPGIIRDDGPGNPPLPLLLPTSKSGMVGENSPKSVTGGDGDGAGRRKNGESIGGPVPPPPPPPPLRTGRRRPTRRAARHAAARAPAEGTESGRPSGRRRRRRAGLVGGDGVVVVLRLRERRRGRGRGRLVGEEVEAADPDGVERVGCCCCGGGRRRWWW